MTENSTVGITQKILLKTGRLNGDLHINNSLHELFMDGLNLIYRTEQMQVKHLLKMENTAASPVLKDALEDHRFVTLKHIYRLEKIFLLLNEKIVRKQCRSINSITTLSKELLKSTSHKLPLKDITVTLMTNRVKHYEIATYSGLILLSQVLSYKTVGAILEKTLGEEEDASEEFSSIAEILINLEKGMNYDTFLFP